METHLTCISAHIFMYISITHANKFTHCKTHEYKIVAILWMLIMVQIHRNMKVIYLGHYLYIFCKWHPLTWSGINSSHTHKLTKSQSYLRLQFLLSGIDYMLIYYRIKKLNACLRSNCATCLFVNSAMCQYSQ